MLHRAHRAGRGRAKSEARARTSISRCMVMTRLRGRAMLWRTMPKAVALRACLWNLAMPAIACCWPTMAARTSASRLGPGPLALAPLALAVFSSCRAVRTPSTHSCARTPQNRWAVPCWGWPWVGPPDTCRARRSQHNFQPSRGDVDEALRAGPGAALDTEGLTHMQGWFGSN